MAAEVRRAREPEAEAATWPSWDGWWEAIESQPGFAAAFEERRRREHDHPHHQEIPTFIEHETALRDAGFREVGTLWQHLDDRVLAAIR